MNEETYQKFLFNDLEKFGETGVLKKHYNHDYFAHKDGWTKFLESGSRFTNRALPEEVVCNVKIVKRIPGWYVEQEIRKIQEAETEKKAR